MNTQNWTSYGNVFNAIVSAIHSDYAGWDMARERDFPRLAVRVSLYNSRYFHGDDDKFLRYVRHYLATLGDPNLTLTKADPDPMRDWTPGFSVRATEEALYITEVFGETRLFVGDRITHIDGLSIPEFRTGIRKLSLYGESPERELWNYYLQYAVSLTAVTDVGEQTFAPMHLPVTTRPDEIIGFWNEAPGVCRMRLDHLEDAEGIFNLVNAHEQEIANSNTLILDLRRCRGGDLSAVLPFLTFLIDHPTVAADLFPEKGLFVKCSPANIRHVPELATVGKQGFCWEPHAYLEDLQVLINPAAGPKQILILTDVTCQNEGELFVKIAAGLPKVKLLGRPTLGNTDYQNLVTISFEDDLFFSYPIGKTQAATDGTGVHGKGVPVDTYLPWTPKECTRDLLLELALSL